MTTRLPEIPSWPTDSPRAYPAPAHIPFVRQSAMGGATRTCGAAVLAMAYESLGQTVDPAAIWHRIAEPSASGERRACSYRMAADALDRGFRAVCALARERPLDAIRRLLELRWRTIVHHVDGPRSQAAGRNRIDAGALWGHYSVVTELAEDSICLSDPLYGPERRYSHRRFLSLFVPQAFSPEVPGGILIAVASAAGDGRGPMGDQRSCPGCAAPLLLPTELGMGWQGPWSSEWNAAYCPRCDACVGPVSHVVAAGQRSFA